MTVRWVFIFMSPKTHRLCEAVADIVHNFSQPCHFYGQPEDSREFVQLCISWAVEFEKLHPDGVADDYIGEIDAFFQLKFDQHTSST